MARQSPWQWIRSCVPPGAAGPRQRSDELRLRPKILRTRQDGLL